MGQQVEQARNIYPADNVERDRPLLVELEFRGGLHEHLDKPRLVARDHNALAGIHSHIVLSLLGVIA